MCKTLIVEDNFIFRNALKGLLRSRFPAMELEEARDGGEALEKVQTFTPDVIFLDIKPSGASCLDLARKIRAMLQEAVVIVFTSYDLPEYRQAASANGATHFLCKGNATSSDILTLMEAIVTGRHPAPPGF
jgi:two-component system response regulator YesN